MNINRYALCKERSLQKIISKQPKPNTTAIGVCSETQVTHHIITKRSDECLPISAYVPKHKEGDDKKFPVIIDIYGGDFVAGRSALNRNFGTWCAEHGYLTFIPEYTPVPETNLFGQLGDLLKAFVVIHRCAERYGADKDTVDKAVRNACSAFLFGTRFNEFSNLIRTMYPLNDDDVIHYLSSPSDWAEETSSVITASNGTASRIYYMARLIAIDRMSELFLTFYEHDSADPKDITNVCKSMMDAVEPYKVVTLVMDYIDDKKMGEHLEVDCPSHLIRDADVLRRKGISVTRISAFAKPEDTQRFVCKHPNLIKQVEKGTNMFDVFVFPIDCITRIRAGEKVLWTNPTT